MDRNRREAGTYPALTRSGFMASAELQQRWFELTRTQMPGMARERGWPVGLDHCFQRILLDNAVGGRWRDHIAAPAYREASDDLLAKAIAIGEEAVRGVSDLHELNRKSLRWRGKVRD